VVLVPPAGARSQRAHDKALDATKQLLIEGGLRAATVDAISNRSGVSKATIYKHWPSRIAIAANAFGLLFADSLPLPDNGNLGDDLVEHVRNVSRFFAGPRGHTFAELLGASVEDPAGSLYFREHFLDERRTTVLQIWNRAVERGEVASDLAPDDVIDLLFGPLVFRLLTGHYELTDANAECLVTTALVGIAHKQAGK
jgi:AcrR family transcriptional regulator